MKYLRTCLAWLLLITILIPLCTTAFAEGSTESPFDVNDNGETYGDYFQSMDAGVDPDLIYAQGEDGIFGYVRMSDLEEPMPESPESALALEAEREANGYTGRYINLYASDGTTVIGQFFVSANETESNSILSRSEKTYSDFSSLQSVNFNFSGRSAIQEAFLGVKFFGYVYSDKVVQAGELGARIQLYNYDTGALVSSTSYDYSEESGLDFSVSKTYYATSGVYYCKGFARVYDYIEQTWGVFGLKQTGNCDID